MAILGKRYFQLEVRKITGTYGILASFLILGAYSEVQKMDDSIALGI
jgi:hypothetical protein